MKRYLLAACALAFAAFLIHGCASVSRSLATWEACDHDLDSLTIEALYFSEDGK